MKIAYQCETCGHYNPTYPVECICGKEMCNSCANDFLCPTCFALKEKWQLKAKPIYEEGELAGWEKEK